MVVLVVVGEKRDLEKWIVKVLAFHSTSLGSLVSGKQVLHRMLAGVHKCHRLEAGE